MFSHREKESVLHNVKYTSVALIDGMQGGDA